MHYRLWVIITCTFGSPTITDVPHWCGMLMVGEAAGDGLGGREGLYGNSVFSAQFCSVPKPT